MNELDKKRTTSGYKVDVHKYGNENAALQQIYVRDAINRIMAEFWNNANKGTWAEAQSNAELFVKIPRMLEIINEVWEQNKEFRREVRFQNKGNKNLSGQYQTACTVGSKIGQQCNSLQQKLKIAEEALVYYRNNAGLLDCSYTIAKQALDRIKEVG